MTPTVTVVDSNYWGRMRAATLASTCDYVLAAVPTSPTSGPWLTSFHATNHATPDRRGFITAGRLRPSRQARQSSVERVPRSACRRDNDLGVRGRQDSGYPGGVLPPRRRLARGRQPGRPFDWPMYPAHSSRSPHARVQMRPLKDVGTPDGQSTRGSAESRSAGRSRNT
jgi:hypothetical protein